MAAEAKKRTLQRVSCLFSALLVLAGASGCVTAAAENNAGAASEESSVSNVLFQPGFGQGDDSADKTASADAGATDDFAEVADSTDGSFSSVNPAFSESSSLILFSASSGLYTEGLTLSLTPSAEALADGGTIFYTLNGSDPERYGSVYTKPLTFSSTEELEVIPVKACLRTADGYSEAQEQVYILCTDTARYGDLSVLSLSLNHNDLYGSSGMLDHFTADDYAGTKVAHAAWLNEDGEIEYEDQLGIRIVGGTSVVFDRKSMMLLADEEWGSHGKLSIKAESLCTDPRDFHYVSEYSRLRIRSGSQDQYYGNVRSSIASRLAEESGFSGALTTRRCLVYLNGKFYGIFNLEEDACSSVMQARYRLPDKDAIQVNKYPESILTNPDCFDLLPVVANVNDEASREELESVVDMDDFLLYYALNLLMNNTDWPDNNYGLWWYEGEPVEGNKYTDGRIRFHMYDVDLIWQTAINLDFYEGSKGDQFRAIMDQQYRAQTGLFPALMEWDCYRDEFLTLCCDLMNTSFSDENLNTVFDEEEGRIESALKAINGDDYLEASGWSICYSELRAEMTDRMDVLREDFSEYFGVTDTYTMMLTASEGTSVTWGANGEMTDGSYVCDYYAGPEITYTASTGTGYTFRHWLLNGEIVSGNEITVNQEMIQNGLITLRAVSEKDSDCSLQIRSLSAAGEEDLVVIENISGEVLDLSDYAVTDDAAEPEKCALPAVSLYPGQLYVLYGQKNQDFPSESLNGSGSENSGNRMQLNFSLSEGETFSITRVSDGTAGSSLQTVDSLAIPSMNEGERLVRQDRTDVFLYEKAE